jgi:hypothetical protein
VFTIEHTRADGVFRVASRNRAPCLPRMTIAQDQSSVMAIPSFLPSSGEAQRDGQRCPRDATTKEGPSSNRVIIQPGLGTDQSNPLLQDVSVRHRMVAAAQGVARS